MGKPTYAARETFMRAADIRTTARLSETVDRVLHTASRNIDESFHRHFYPETATYTYAFTGGGQGFFLERDLYTLTSATVDGTAQTVSEIELYPTQYAPPYSWIGLMGEEVAITGVWGYSQDTTPAGALEEAISDTTGTTVDVTDASKIGVGDLIIVDAERMIVTDNALLDTTVDLNDTLTADASDTAVTVTDGSSLNQFEVITIDSERMLIESISGNDLTVARGYDGSTLAAHSGAVDVYARRRLTVERGATGSTAATHSDTTAITLGVPPYEIQSLCIAEAMNIFQQEQSAYARTIGSGESQREARGRGLEQAREMAAPLKRRRLAAI